MVYGDAPGLPSLPLKSLRPVFSLVELAYSHCTLEGARGTSSLGLSSPIDTRAPHIPPSRLPQFLKTGDQMGMAHMRA